LLLYFFLATRITLARLSSVFSGDGCADVVAHGRKLFVSDSNLAAGVSLSTPSVIVMAT
jgi:hypothetical protein